WEGSAVASGAGGIVHRDLAEDPRRTRNELTTGSQSCVDLVERDAAGDHQHLGVVKDLAELGRDSLRPLVLGGHPGLSSLLDQLLSDRVYAGVELGHRTRTLGPGLRLLVELAPQSLERLH